MPNAAPKPCTTCGVLVRDGTARCPLHKPQAWAKRPDSPKRVTGRALQRERARLFNRDPLCVKCKEAGHVTLATQRDHKVPLAEGGTDTDDNVQGLCDACHREKTLAEALRGRARATTPADGAPHGTARAAHHDGAPLTPRGGRIFGT